MVWTFVAPMSASAQANEAQQAAVTGLSVSPGSSPGDLNNTWDAHPENPPEYRVVWALNGDDFPTINDTDQNACPSTNSYTVTGLTPDASYQASVKAAFDQESESEWSAIAMGNSAAETEPAPTPEPVDGDSGGTLSDPLIYLRDPSGNSIINNTDINPTNVGFTTGFGILDDNSGNGNNAQLKIDVNSSGKYIIVAAATGTSNAGTYTLVVTRTE